MEENKEHITFELTDEIIDHVEHLIEANIDANVLDYFNELHYADIAEILDELTLDRATYVIKLLDSETTSDVLSELDEDVSSKILENLSAKEIAEEVVELDSDDAADLLGELPEDRQERVIAQLKDEELVAELQELMAYDEDTAGGLMAKELVKVYETWTVAGCLRKIRTQAEQVTRVHSIYVVDKQDKLIGRLSLKDLIVSKNELNISEIYIFLRTHIQFSMRKFYWVNKFTIKH